MSALVWGSFGERFFETGIDRGVLYPSLGPGIPWNGLTSVSESPNGGQPTPFYADGFKYLNLASAEEFVATIEAFSAPPEFAECDGTLGILNGLFITQQPRKQFGLSYRTRVGNDIDSTDHGYKLHLVYNALAAPSARDNRSLSNSPEAITLSWQITTLPPEISGYRPSAHFVVDSRQTPLELMSTVEGLLYGSDSNDPFLPSVSVLMELFSTYDL